MKNIFEKKNLVIFILLAMVLSMAMATCNSWNARKNDAKKYAQNLEAMKKELTTEKNKNGDLQTSVVAFEGDKRRLEEYSKDLAQEVKSLKNRDAKVIIKTQIVYRNSDTLNAKNELLSLGNGNYDLKWKYVSADSNRILEGNSGFFANIIWGADSAYKLDIKPKNTFITTDIMKLDFVVGVAHNKKTGFDEIFVTPKNSDVTIGKLEGAILDKKKDKKFSVGIYAGYGVIYSDGNLKLGPSIGVSISRTIFKF